MSVRVGVGVLGLSRGRGQRSRQRETTVLDAFGRDDALGCAPEHARRSAHDDHLEAVVVIEVHVQRGDHLLAEVVLHLRERLGELADVMIVHQRERAARLGLVVDLLDEIGPDEIADRLAAIHVSLRLDARVEAFEQISVDRDAETNQL